MKRNVLTKMTAVCLVIAIIMSFSATGIYAQEANLISHWTFNTDGTNSVTGGIDLNVSEQGVTYETVEGRKGITISGAAGGLIYSHNTAIDLGSNFTVAMFLKGETVPGYEILFAKGRKDEATHFELYLENGYLQFWIPSLSDFRSDTLVKDGQMHHIAFTYNGQTGTFYVDGVSVKTVEVAGAVTGGTGEALMIGSLVEQSIKYEGFIDDIRIYNTALTSEDVQTLATAEEPETIPETETEPSPETGISLLPVMLSILTVSGSLSVIKKRRI